MSSPALGLPAGGSGLRHTATVLGLLAWAAAALVLDHAGASRVLTLVLLAPVLEEAAFRAGLHEWLLSRRAAPWAANLAVAGAFALLHLATQGRWEALLVAGPALVVGAVYNRWRRLRWCVLLHAAMNAAWLAAPLVFRAS
jgi:membrane protease YdiL (CAAX protease family)